MKTRITLTMDAKRVEKLRRWSRKRRISVAALVEDLTDALGEAQKEADVDWVEGLKGALTGRITKKDLDQDPRLAKILSK